MDDIVKAILRAVSQVWPKAKPTITTQFFEADTKQPEKFVVTLGDIEQHRVSMASEGATQEQAMGNLRKNLATWMLNFHGQEVERHFKERAVADAFHNRLRQVTENLTPPKE